MMTTQKRGPHNDPRCNRMAAYRLVARTYPAAKADEIIRLVKEQFGHEFTPKNVYLMKSKEKRAERQRLDAQRLDAQRLEPLAAREPQPNTPAHLDTNNPERQHLDALAAIMAARQLLKCAGSVQRAIDLIRAAE